ILCCENHRTKLDAMGRVIPYHSENDIHHCYERLGLTVVYTVFYSLLFAFVYAQLWLVLRYRHKRFSYQTAFLFLCLLWAALRAVLFSFYFRDCVTANTLGPFTFWLLYCCPVCLQFFTLSLMNLYCAQVFFKAKSKYFPELLKYKVPLYLVFVGISLLFLLVNLVCALLVKTSDMQVKTIVLVRVTINDTLFVLCAVSLSVCLYKVAKMSLASIYLESKGTSVCQVTLIGVMVVLLYASRACYNLVVLALTDIENINSFDYDWYNVSDQADLRSTLGDAGYIVFGVILFVWELLPTSLVVYFFRVRKPTQDKLAERGFSTRETAPALLFPATSSQTDATSLTIQSGMTVMMTWLGVVIKAIFEAPLTSTAEKCYSLLDYQHKPSGKPSPLSNLRWWREANSVKCCHHSKNSLLWRHANLQLF
uniref:G protein-coupled receptor 137Bb n=1 Tax=Denticeps clupeoides TaxID=299321 RepID=A0AAY4EJ82_9TELE